MTTHLAMTSSQAKREFQIRYFLWATSEFKDEIDKTFHNFRSFKDSHVWKLHRFMEKLNKSDQLCLASALLKRFHPEAVHAQPKLCLSKRNPCVTD